MVWYVAYGSNLAIDRFRCYLAGGRPAGGSREYAGCRDPRDPARSEGVEVPGGLVFASESGVWGGGMAFFDRTRPGVAACRAHLITAEQLGDVAAQERRRPPGGGFARHLAGLLPDVETVVATGPGPYETVVRLGELDGTPMFTITHHDVPSLPPAAPTAPYLRWIAVGLREAHGYDAARTARYLARAPGVSGAWTEAELAEVAAVAGVAEPVGAER
ncbi:MAG: histone deacetylase [Nocardioides sp.]